jgi:ribosomal protein L40E
MIYQYININIKLVISMVYCHKCGTKNEDDAEYCSKCGSSLKDSDDDYRDRRHRRRRDDGYPPRGECFGLPHGGLIVGLIVGILLILFGISSIYGFGFWQYIWPIIIVIIGVLFVAGAIYNYSRRR